MKIDKLELHNYKGFKDIQFDFDEKMNLFIGVNGSGKTSFLDAMAIALSWLVNRIQRDKSKGSRILDEDLRNETDKGYIEIQASHGATNYCWKLTKSAEGIEAEPSSYEGVSDLSEIIRKCYHEESMLPVIVYYPVSRAVERRIGLSIRTFASLFDVYEKALKSTSNFHSLFEWLRNRDDILNEQSRSRSEWMKQNKRWIQRRINYILTPFEEFLSDENSAEEFRYLSRIFKNEIILEEPRTLFGELANLTKLFRIKPFKQSEIIHAIDGMEYMFNEMSSLSADSRDNLIEDNNQFSDHILNIIKSFRLSINQQIEEELKRVVRIVWETFSFAILLSLWWMSTNGRDKVENVLREQFSPMRRHRNLMHENELVEDIRSIIQEDISVVTRTQRSEGSDFQIVKQSIEYFVPKYTNLQVRRVPRPRMEITKNGEVFNMNQLSDGEKNLIALIGDIARRLTMANPTMDNPLEGAGIIMIDEIDLHLHPKLQRIVAQKLPEIFSNCQFFITTHSPQVIGHIKPESIFVLENVDNVIQYSHPDESYGMSIERVVELIMDDFARSEKSQKDIDWLFELIERKKFEKAKKILDELKKDMKTDPDIMRAELLLRLEERQK